MNTLFTVIVSHRTKRGAKVYFYKAESVFVTYGTVTFKPYNMDCPCEYDIVSLHKLTVDGVTIVSDGGLI